MAEARATASVWDIRAEDITLKRYKDNAALYVELGGLVSVTLGLDRAAAALEAEAMRRLAEIATEAAEELERRAAARKAGSDG